MDEPAPPSPQRPPLACPLPIPPIELRCPNCAYELTGLTQPRCPECGRPFDPDDLFEHALDSNAPAREAVLRLTFGTFADALAGPIHTLAAAMGVTLTSGVGILAQQHLDRTLDREPTPTDFRGLYDQLAAGPDLLIPLPRPPRTLGADFAFPEADLRCRRCRAPLAGATRPHCPRCGEPIDPAELLPRETLVAVTLEARQRQPLAILLARTALETEGIPNAAAAGNLALQTIGGVSLATLSVPRSYFLDALAFLEAHRPASDELVDASEDDWTCPACKESVPATFDVCWNCGEPRE